MGGGGVGGITMALSDFGHLLLVDFCRHRPAQHHTGFGLKAILC